MDRRTYNAIRQVLTDSVEGSVRLARAGDEARAEDYPLVADEYLSAMPERARPAAKAAAQRLRDLCSDGDRTPADVAVANEALKLAEVLPRSFSLPRQDPAALAAKVLD
jgi:hypothetical protein